MKFLNICTISVLILLGSCDDRDRLGEVAAMHRTVDVSLGPDVVSVGTNYMIASTVFDNSRRITIRLPAEYKADPERAFPVVYVIDGGPEQDFPHIAGIAQSREMNFTFEPFILVGIETENRRHEITPTALDPEAYTEMLGATPGGSEEFRRFIREDVMTWVAGQFRTNGSNAVMGESLAGLFIVETLLKDPTLFDDYIAVSPSLWWDNLRLAEEATADLAAMPDGDRRLYLTMGDEGYLMQGGLDGLIAALEAGAPDDLLWTYVERKGSETHGSIYHVAALDAFRAFFLTAQRTGGANPAMFPDGVVPPLTDEAKESLEQPCVRERAVPTTFEEKNKDLERWAAMCLLMKPGAVPTSGNLTY